MSLETVLARFERKQPCSSGWMVRCPAHDDARASLSIGRGQDGRVLLYCHAGCHTETILSALGLADADLFEKPPDHDDILYDYIDESGQLLYQVVRRPGKRFLQRRPDGLGGWLYKLGDCRRVLYALPELKGKQAVFIVEGEKDANRLWSLNLPATTNAQGAGKWRDDFAQQLLEAGVKRVAILPDNDAPGEAHARTIALSCHAAGLLTFVVPLEGVPPKGDVSDYLDTHNKAQLCELVKQAAPFNPSVQKASQPLGFELTSLDQLLDEPESGTDWLVEDRIPTGSVILLAGKPKAGKSTLARALAFAVAQGERWLGWDVRQGLVWYLALEDKREELRRHFFRMGARRGIPLQMFIGQAPADLLAQMVERAKNETPVLIVVDTLQRLLGFKDLNDYAEVTTKFSPLLALSRETGAALVCVHHAKKNGEGQDSILGSTALAGSVDNMLILARGEEHRTLETVQRIGTDLEATVVELDPDTGHVSLSCKKREADELDCAKRIIALLQTTTEPVTERWIREQVEARPQDQARALRRLWRQGAIARDGKGQRGNPYVWSIVGHRDYTEAREGGSDVAVSGSAGSRGSEDVPKPLLSLVK